MYSNSYGNSSNCEAERKISLRWEVERAAQGIIHLRILGAQRKLDSCHLRPQW